MGTVVAGIVGMLNNAGIRNARVEFRAEPRRGWYINDVFAGPDGRRARTAIRVNAERFRRRRKVKVPKRYVLRRVR
jgi:hypothetical protein